MTFTNEEIKYIREVKIIARKIKLKTRVMPAYQACTSTSLSRSRKRRAPEKVFQRKEKVEMMDYLSCVLYLRDL